MKNADPVRLQKKYFVYSIMSASNLENAEPKEVCWATCVGTIGTPVYVSNVNKQTW